tara:strand:+ start:11342 stop:11644 length:303 start_codon:yes stop_codon:yes gene_type:complete
MKLINILFEELFDTYEGMVQVIHSKETGAETLAALLRALPGVTTVTTAGQDTNRNLATYKIKLITQKSGIEAFKKLKSSALSKYSAVKVVKVGDKTITKK